MNPIMSVILIFTLTAQLVVINLHLSEISNSLSKIATTQESK